jgi:hypothetical protein
VPGIRRVATLLVLGTLATAPAAEAAGGHTHQAQASRPGWIVVPTTPQGTSRAAEGLGLDLGVAPRTAQELIDASYQ